MKDQYKVWLVIGAILVITGLLSEFLIALGVIILIVVLILHLRAERRKQGARSGERVAKARNEKRRRN
ncbi:MAG TPA: hypothetical protein HA282_05285 [Nanoarchaeota archaeon]|nr:hypothetical protein [Nanoarchaeota archaeon]HIH33875.1 hypothetical protein [Nanoarchaeota archaeon]HIH51079.1 hypothetical protein [Nanoarchaeota archaeon]HIH66595.1 hypothetical protein [Nanoarchaeota archaeon]